MGMLVAVAVILLACHLLGGLSTGLRQPRVVGEMLGGLVLGPGVLGAVWASGHRWLFPPDVTTGIGLTAELGIVVFVFLLGSELSLPQVRTGRRAIALVVAGAMGVPLLAGVALAWAGHGTLGGAGHSPSATILFVGLAMSITALPVLARILADLRMERTPVGTLALASAAAGDAVTWLLLTILLGVVGEAGAGGVFTRLALAGGFVAAMLAVVRPAVAALAHRCPRDGPRPEYLLPVLVAGAVVAAAASHAVGLHAVIGAFLFGLAVPRGHPAIAQAREQLRGFTVTVLLPLFFASVGLKVTIGEADGTAVVWLLLVAILVVAAGGKLLGAGLGARLAGWPARQAWQLGALMNCRGVTELVVLAIGYEYRLISGTGLTLLVVMALATTAMTGPVARLAGLQRAAIEVTDARRRARNPP